MKLDVAVDLPEATPAGTLVAAIEKAGKELLAGSELFDVYRGKNLGPGRKSLASHLQQEVHRAKRFRTGFSVLVLEVDDFPGLIHKIGVRNGDLIQREVGLLLRNAVRDIDPAARLGPAVQRGVDRGNDWQRDEGQREQARAIMFGQNSETVFNAAKAGEK